jgi:outer membrane protein assembly factor BamD
MKKSRTWLKWCLPIVLMVFLLSGCAVYDRFFGKGDVDEEVGKPPGELWKEGMKHYKGGYYASAAEAFRKLKDRYPYSEFALKAELLLADSLYKSEKYDLAFDAYSDFERLHPRNENIPYVIYQRGKCHLNQVKTIDRDQSHTFKAKAEFERLIKRFPNSKHANMARKEMRACYINLAEHELYVGHYYFKRKNYRGAMGRYQYVLDNYPDLGQYQVALEYLNKCKQKLAEQESVEQKRIEKRRKKQKRAEEKRAEEKRAKKERMKRKRAEEKAVKKKQAEERKAKERLAERKEVKSDKSKKEKAEPQAVEKPKEKQVTAKDRRVEEKSAAKEKSEAELTKGKEGRKLTEKEKCEPCWRIKKPGGKLLKGREQGSPASD